MILRPKARELIAGIADDPTFGPVWPNRALSAAIVRSQTTCSTCPPPIAYPATIATTDTPNIDPAERAVKPPAMNLRAPGTSKRGR